MEGAAKLKVPDWKLARNGIELLINNKISEAETLFKQHLDSIQVQAGYSCTLFMDALMTFEDDKLNLALSSLHELERQCTLGSGIFRSFKNLFVTSPQTFSYADNLETQIILADSQLCISILTFLQQDISGYFKGGWILRKSWKLYQQLFKEIAELYEKKVGKLQLPELVLENSNSSSSETPSETQRVPNTAIPSVSGANGYTQHKLPRSHTVNFHEGDSRCSESSSLIKKSISVTNALSKRSKNERRRLSETLSGHLSLFGLNVFSQAEKKVDDIDSETVTRLMGAVSFGYGLFQLGISLLPPPLLRVSNIFGFNGDKDEGLQCLMYARLSCDMRAPLATLALLWYHTIVRPFYALDGRNVQAGVEISKQLLEESKEAYRDSALFLFFSGRVHRLNSEIPEALNRYLSSAENTSHREIKILSMHEIGWCYLILLDFNQASITFEYLKNASRWSRAFYTHLGIICQGSSTGFKDVNFVAEMKELLSHGFKETQLEDYLNKRIKIYPTTVEDLRLKEVMYWKLLVYEILYLWNALPSCSGDNQRKIITECAYVTKNAVQEPLIGLSKLIEGNAYCNLKQISEGIACFRECLEMRKYLPTSGDGTYVSAFAQYELGALLVNHQETKEEGKILLQNISYYREYDFEHRLSVRVNSMLKHL